MNAFGELQARHRRHGMVGQHDVHLETRPQDLQRFGGTCFTVHEADVAALVTTSGFTAPAVEYAAHCGIVCLDGEALRAWSEGTGPAPWELPAPAPGAGLPPQ